MHQMATNATRGTLEALDDPAAQEKLSRAVGIATESALTTALDSFQRRGAWGGGPPSTYGTPVGAFECTGPDRKNCVDRRVYDVNRLAAIGVAHSVRIPIIVVTFLGGFLVALIATAAFRRAGR
jgi:hypothetical protein